MNTMRGTRREFLKTTALGVAASALAGLKARGASAAPKKPNIIFIMVDDMGPQWTSCYGGEEIETPNIDALAKGGMQFMNAYSMPQCTPTRVTLLTGQYPWRHGWVNHWDVPRWGVGYFDWEQNASFARVVKKAGYVTAAAGKWQINDFRVVPDAMQKHGFDEFCMWTGWESGNEPSQERYWDPYIVTNNDRKTYKGQYGPDVFTDFLIDFMKRHKDQQMLLYYPMVLTHGPHTHTPLEPDVASGKETFQAEVRYTDMLLGRIVGALDDLGIRDNTIVIWTTDNGGGPTTTRNGRSVTGGKGRTTENGSCEPFIVNCPGLVPSGVVTDALTDFTDMLPTFAELAGAPLPKDKVDGHSIAKLILGKEKDSSREWIMALGGGGGALSDETGRVIPIHEYRDRVIRDKQYKLYVGLDRKSEKLIDLLADPGEQANIIDSIEPRVVAARKKLEAVAAAFPKKDALPRYREREANAWDSSIENKGLKKTKEKAAQKEESKKPRTKKT